MQKRKLNISMMLKVPVDIEIEVLAVLPENAHQAEDTKDNKNIGEDSQALVSQPVARLEQTGNIFSTLPHTQHEQENPENYEQEIAEKPDEYVNTLLENTTMREQRTESLSREDCSVIQRSTRFYKKTKRGRVLDSFNDALALSLNTMGIVLFLGKLANYSWDYEETRWFPTFK